MMFETARYAYNMRGQGEAQARDGWYKGRSRSAVRSSGGRQPMQKGERVAGARGEYAGTRLLSLCTPALAQWKRHAI
eukprot:scaffold243365_cov33-Tisochrysis_lutea.AAC.4